MENEIRYYLKQVELAIAEGTFVPQYLVTAARLPTGSIELAINNSDIVGKIDYLLDAYDENMCLKSNTEVKIENILIV